MEPGKPGTSRQAGDDRWPITDAGGFDDPGLEYGADQRGAQIRLSRLQTADGRGGQPDARTFPSHTGSDQSSRARSPPHSGSF